MEQVFIELTIVLALGIGISAILRLLKQPLIIGYMLTGVLASPFLFNIVKSHDALATFAEMGVVLLLFLVGLNLNPKIIKDVGKVSVIAGLSQIGLTMFIGFILMYILGFDLLVSLYVSIAMSFSSTIIIMKFLTDKKDLDSLHGKIAVGLLIIQDLVAIFVLLIISSSLGSGDVPTMIFEALIKGFGLIILTLLLGMFVLPAISTWAAKSQEFLLMFSLGWCLIFAAAFYLSGFSMEIGALLAGVTLASSPFKHEISSKLRPLRDFFLVLFFILLGSQMAFSKISEFIIPIIVLSLFVIIIKPLIVIVLLGFLRYSKRTNFLTGATMAQISEFSLIVIALGASVGHLSKEVLSLVTVVGFISIAASTYIMKYSNKIYPKVSKHLSKLERRGKKIDDQDTDKDIKYDIVMFGYNRIGHDILESLKLMKHNFLVIDYNPDTIANLAKQGIDCKYGDANDLELLNDLDFQSTKMIISTIPDIETNLLLISRANQSNGMIITIVVSHQIDEATELYQAGATYVVMPHFLGGKHTSMMLKDFGLDIDKFLKERLFHIENLKSKKQMGYEHPKTNTSDWKSD